MKAVRILLAPIALTCLISGVGCSKSGTEKISGRPGAASSPTTQTMSAFLDRFEATVVEMEKTDWSHVSASDMGNIAAAQMEMAEEADKIQRNGYKMTSSEMRRYGKLTQRLTVVIQKAQAAMGK